MYVIYKGAEPFLNSKDRKTNLNRIITVESLYINLVV